ncbi:MAG TPA: hypothetical protein ENN84_10920 [Candidatus Marinimicrobia bacterium]|nr:hypothetical protein [Candidatus Neomarinimicrobiota bacterium]
MKMRFLIIFFVLGVGLLQGQVTFTKPGSMMHIPTSSVWETPYIFRAGFGSDLFAVGGNDGMKSAKGVFFDSQISSGFNFGLSAVQDDLSPDSATVDFALNLSKNIVDYGDISIAVGIWDFVFQQTDGRMQLKDNYSFFAVISSEKELGRMGLNTYMGVGSGGLAKAFATNDSMRTAGIFAGFLLRTNPEAPRGGLEVMGEFDGSGINAGVRIPITTDYKLNLGISQLQWLPNFGKANTSDLPAISAGLSLEIPRLDENIQRRGRPQMPSVGKGMLPAAANWEKTDPESETKIQAKIDSVLRLADIEIQKLNDSLRVTVAEVYNLQNTVSNLRQQKSVLEDSLQSVKLQHHVMEQNINLALKHLSRSLRFFYAGDYAQALDDVDMAIQLNPNLALAYARRGSIYYKMGDLERATINWNLALRIDPEYEDVRNILKIINENRIRTASYQRDK